MKKINNAIASWAQGLFKVWKREYSLIFGDLGAILFFFALPILYPISYALIYNPEIIRDSPIVVVDHSASAESRHLIRMIDATQPIKVEGYAADMNEARRAMYEGKCFAILEIPADYARKLGRGEQANASFYTNMTLLLRYRQYTVALTEVQLACATEIAQKKIADLGGDGSLPALAASPMSTEQMFVGDPSQGFASFIMPGILVLILQQSMVLGTCIIAGGSAERRRRYGIDPRRVNAPGTAVTLGKTLCYLSLYLPIIIYTLHIVPWMFDFPRYGNFFEATLLILPLLIASSMFGQSLSVFVRERESSFLVIVFTSVIFLFLSGLTWPRYAMSKVWQFLGDCVPATWGLEGFVRINSDAGTLAQQSHPYLMLWILCLVYFITASLIARYVGRRNRMAPTGAPAPDEVVIP